MNNNASYASLFAMKPQLWVKQMSSKHYNYQTFYPTLKTTQVNFDKLSSWFIKLSIISVLIYSCTKYGIPGMCFHIFPTCDPLTRDAKPRLCREDCNALFKDVCLVELQYAAFDPTFSNVLPDCSALPKRGSKDHSYCKSIGIPGR